MSVVVDVGNTPAHMACEACKSKAWVGLNCSDPPTAAQHDCITPADLCAAALARKEQFAQEVLAFTQQYKVDGVSVDWETQSGNDPSCFRDLWSHVVSAIRPHGKTFTAWVTNAGGQNGGGNTLEWNYSNYLPFADALIDMGTYWTQPWPHDGHANRSLEPVPCAAARGRWCGLEGTIVDMLAHGAEPAQVVPGVWMARCYPNGTMTLTGWTQSLLRSFLQFATSKGVRAVAVWTDGAMSQVQYGIPGGGNPALSTCAWFVPELLRWEAGLPAAQA